MKLWIAAFGLLLGSTAAVAEQPPGKALVDDLVELRESIGGADAVATDERQFADALRREANGRNQESRQSAEPSGYWMPPPPSQSAPADPRKGRPSWDQVFNDVSQPLPNHPIPPRPPHAPRPPKHQLLHSAFELEKIAHHLEMADLGKEADAVRDAAGKLRRSARDSRGSEHGDAKDHREKRRKREKQERRAAETKLRRLKQAMAQAEAAQAEAENARQNAEQARKMAEERRRRTEAARKEAQRHAERRKTSPKPPKGVHGGPRDGHDGSADIDPGPR